MEKHPAGTRAALTGDGVFYLAAAFVIAAPRLARILYPELVIEDDFYLQNAFLLSTGERPYLDFTLNHFPLLEYAFAALVRLLGPSIELAEYVTQACVAVNTLAVLILGSRLCGRRAGLAAAALYGCSALVFKYHLFEREFFTSTCMLTGLYFWLFVRRTPVRLTATACLFALAALFKLTSAVFFAVILLRACMQKRYRECALMLGVFACLLAGSTLLCAALYGKEFIFQVYVFHFMKGYRSLPGRMQCFVENTDFSIFCGLLGFFFYRARGNAAQWGLIRLLMLACPVFFIVFSSTAWPHNLLEMLAFASLLGGAYIRMLPGSLAAAVQRPARAVRPSGRFFACAAAAVFVFALARPWNIEGAHKRMGNLYGFGSVPRREVGEAVRFIAGHTGARDVICCPVPLIAFASGRKKVINYWESAGVEAWVRQRIEQAGLWRAFRQTKKIRFVDLIADVSSAQTRELFERQVALKKPVLVVRPDFRGEESFAAKLARGILDGYAGPVVFRNRFFVISKFISQDAPDEGH